MEMYPMAKCISMYNNIQAITQSLANYYHCFVHFMIGIAVGMAPAASSCLQRLVTVLTWV